MSEKKISEEEIIRAFHMMWDNYPEQVRLIDRSFRVVAGNPSYIAGGGQAEVKCNVGDPELHRKCQAIAALSSGETRIVTNEIAGMEFEAYWVPVEGAPDYFVHFNNGLNEIIAKLAGKQR